MSSSTSTASFASVFGRWTQPNASESERDIEAQIVSGSYEQLSTSPFPLALPPAARAHVPRTHTSLIVEDEEEGADPLDAFFGVTYSRSMGTQDSRHDATASATHEEDLPAYSAASEPPAYDSVAEHPTLAMYLFKLGFLFPLFWLAGSLILLSPLNAPEDWEPYKTDEERAELLERMRSTEVKWGKRCLVAVSVVVLAVVGIALAVVFAMRS